ncbi:MAG: acyl-CoA reductase [Ferruginibacter sp.]|nr:acyl-CoA reductase [Ferruginibacter sp.]
MNVQERIELMVKAGEYLQADTEEWQEIKQQAFYKNGWFTPEFIQHAANQMANNFLTKNALEKWVAHYHIDDNIQPKNVGIVMAGNIPMVGFHDMLAVFISGHYQTVKLSGKDDILLKHLVKFLYSQDVEIQNHIMFADMLKGCDAYIATGGNSAAKSFEEYFGKYPNIIRKNRTSVAVLTGNETPDELKLLADDIHLYFGLGCRNVTKLYVPQEYDFVPLLKSFEAYKHFADHHKYKNNYDYNLSIILLNNVYYMTNEATLLVENKGLFSPISQLFYEYYDDVNVTIKNLQNINDVQCIVGKEHVPFGAAQNPNLFTYADGEDTMEFLLGL